MIVSALAHTVNANSSYTPWEVGYRRNTTNEEYRQIYIDIYENGFYKETIKAEKIVTVPLNNSYYHFDIYYKYENGFIDGVKESLDFTYN